MNLARLDWYGVSLRRQTRASVIVPEVDPPEGGWPVLYLLHGMMEDSDGWLLKGKVIEQSRRWPMLIVTPDGENAGYTRTEYGLDHFAHVATDLPDMVERTFRCRTDRGGRGVGGLSMGGYGALRLALARPDRYVSCHSHSGALLLGSRPTDDETWRRAFGDDPAGSDHDLLGHAAAVAALPIDQRPRLRIDCGRDDFLFDDNEAFHARLTELDVEHAYHREAGAHTWDYWDEHLPAALAFHAEAFGIKPVD